jgi:hypothetical protein
MGSENIIVIIRQFKGESLKRGAEVIIVSGMSNSCIDRISGLSRFLRGSATTVKVKSYAGWHV